ncbi:hypothetical protein KDA_74720 [Dictyobacter alpinus]|uniref:Uncharacterized protein n=1 Tax=Dictyobacter alpinus TaxID=2014873 RepID=A0A402BKU8_9CHLR|nr:hypothetical protein [Dictyobacter alpinus]GCE31988.1 hypothetical protein KDA_74720 [Dictyobacter alpinus]
MHVIPQTEAIRLYCGSAEDDWNTLPVEVGPFACISPVYGRTLATKSPNYVRLSPKTLAIVQDSGAFCDGPGQRLSFEAALRRQIKHAEQCSYADRVTHRASYDQLIDEKWDYQGRRRKSRWSEADAWEACITTIQAARFLSVHRENLRCIFSAQGVTASQYLSCVQGVLPYLQEGDMLGLGGFCILGRFPRQTMPIFREIIHEVIPFVGREGVRQIHIWGCLFAPALGELLWLCDQYGIKLSTDSAYPSLRPVLGRWGYASWADKTYTLRRPPNGPELGRQRKIHCWLVRRWLANFRDRELQHYRWRAIRQQHRIFEDEEAPVLSIIRKEDHENGYHLAVRENGLASMDSA